MFNKLTDSQKGWLAVTIAVVETVAIYAIVRHCNKSIKADNEKMIKLMETDECQQFINTMKE